MYSYSNLEDLKNEAAAYMELFYHNDYNDFRATQYANVA
jgi:hypothetical protein